MTVYVIVQLKMIDRAAYDRYRARFFDLFKKFSGRLQQSWIRLERESAVTTTAQTRSRGRTAPAPHTGKADSHKVGRSNKRGNRDGRHNAGNAGRDAAH
jgi:hypothetical protein